MNRRRIICALCGLTTPYASCLSSQPSRSGETSAPPSPSECQDSVSPPLTDVHVPRSKKREIDAGPIGGFALSLSPDPVPVGGDLTVRIYNETDAQQVSGKKRKFLIERQTEAGWQSIYDRPENEGWTDEAIPHASDEGFTWTFTMTPSGLSAPDGTPSYYVCERVDPGKYRFVYWGVTTIEERTSNWKIEQALGTQFKMTES